MCITKLKEHYLSKHDQKLTKHSHEFRKVYHDHLDVTCYICAKYFPDKNSLENHKIKHHKTRDERTKYEKYQKCQFCAKRLVSSHELLMHGIKYHSDQNVPYLCHDCPQEKSKSIKNINEMIQHVETHHLSEISKGDSVNCEKCSSEFSCNQILDAHYFFQHQHVRFCCYICGNVVQTYG